MLLLHRILLLIIFLSGYTLSYAQVQADINILFEYHPEIYVIIDASNEQNRHDILKSFSGELIDGGDAILLNLIRDEWHEFDALGLEYIIHSVDRDDRKIEVFPDKYGLPEGTWNQYPTYDGYVAMMSQFESNYSQLCKIHSIKTLNSGREILFARIGDNVNVDEAEPVFMYTSTMHGDETAGYVLMLRLIDYLLSNYGIDPRVTALVDSVDIWINPLANPDGTYHGGNNSVAQATRRNANYVDLNRNFHDPQDGPHPDGNPWQPETVAFMDMSDTIPFTMAANFHGGAEVVNYPWDTWPVLAADDLWWIFVSNEYADTCQSNSPSGYMNDFGTGITNGYAWYTTNGSRQDYMNYFRHCREATIEISSTKLLPSSQLESFWDYNYRSFLNYIEQCTYGLHGIVRDSISKAPVRAFVEISNHDKDSSQVWSDALNGDYHRLLKGGLYTLTFSSPGYYPKTISNVSISDHQHTWLTVDLAQIGASIAEETDPGLMIFPNPANSDLKIEFTAGMETWLVTDINGSLISTGALNPGARSLNLDTSGWSEGVYTIQVLGKKTTTTRRIVVAH